MESPYKEILIFVFGGGLITGIISLSKEIRERIAEKKRQKLAEADAHLSNAAEARRLDNESDEAMWLRLNQENARLTAQVKELSDSPSLSFATKTRWYKCYRELGVKIDKHETNIAREKTQPELLGSLDDLRKKYDELGEKMP